MQKIHNAGMMLLIIGLTSCDKSGIQDDARDVADIKALSATRAKAFNEGNADEIAATFTESGSLMAPDMTSMTGREAVRGYYQRIFDQYKTFLGSVYKEVMVPAISPMAWDMLR